MKIPFLILCILCLGSKIHSQAITVEADNYQHVFEGGGVSVGLFILSFFKLNAQFKPTMQVSETKNNLDFYRDYF